VGSSSAGPGAFVCFVWPDAPQPLNEVGILPPAWAGASSGAPAFVFWRATNVRGPGGARELKEGLARIYGNHLRRAYLHGSYARGEQVEGSDVDPLIVLDRIERYFAELQRTGELASEVSLRYGLSVSSVFVQEREWEMQDSAFLANVRGEAVAA